MILILLFAGTIIFSISMIFQRTGFTRNIWITIGLILTVGSLLLIDLNSSNHFGMKQTATTTTIPLTSSVKGKQVLLYKPIGTKNERVYLYRSNPLDSQLLRTDPMNTTVNIKRNESKNEIQITKKYWVYPDEEQRLLFSVGVPNHELASKHFTFIMKPGWSITSFK